MFTYLLASFIGMAMAPPTASADSPLTSENTEANSSGHSLPSMCAHAIEGPGGQQIDWPKRLMDDDANAAQQRKVITSLGRRFDDFTRNSVNAPIDIESDKLVVNGGVFRIYQYCFIVHCDLQQFTDTRPLEALFDDESNRQPPQELGHHGGDQYTFSETQSLLKRVRIEAVLRRNHRRSSRSSLGVTMVVAADPNDPNDARRQSRWAAIATPDQMHPYLGMAALAKATTMAELPNALFVEVHFVFYEPTEWFSGKNLLGAKLPLVIQNRVRQVRRDLAKSQQNPTKASSQ